MRIDPQNRYTRMQREYYDKEASKWTPENRDPVVGSFDAHNAWGDYELLFDGIDTSLMIALDFGCGVGRCLVKYAPRFWALDGVDISPVNLEAAKKYKVANGVATGVLFLCNGIDLRDIEPQSYDLVYSVICLQHICVHEIRMNLIREICRVLKNGGIFTFQLGEGGKPGYQWVEWHEDRYDAGVTNGYCDVSVTSRDVLVKDLKRVGFHTVELSDPRPTGPGDAHKNWLFVRCIK